jgi:hypothetical protein
MIRLIARRGVFGVATAAAWLLLGALPTAQTSNFTASDPGTIPSTAGWTIVPGVGFATSWDDNVLMKGNGDDPVGANVSALSPRLNVDYHARRTQVSGSYDGSFLLYQNLGDLNSYDQRMSVSARHQANRRVTILANGSAAFVPTTELVAFVGVPFVRTGSEIAEAHAGVDLALDKHSSLSATYNIERISFDPTDEFANILRGGHSQGATFGWHRTISPQLTLIADYDLQRSTVTERVVGNPIGDFNIQNASGGVEYKLSPNAHVFGSLGIARVGITAFGPAKTGPAWRTGVAYQRRRAGMDVNYSRSFVPSYSFGGTLQNEEVVALLRYMFSKHLSARGSYSWRSNQSLVITEPNLYSIWLEGSLAYELRNWMRIEGFYIRARQSINRPGGLLDRNRIGVQIVTSNPIRVR